MNTNFFINCRKAALSYRAINHKLRQQILTFLKDQPRTVTEVLVHLRLEQSVASQHLATLRQAKLVSTRKDGKFVFYSINTDGMKALTDANAALGHI